MHLYIHCITCELVYIFNQHCFVNHRANSNVHFLGENLLAFSDSEHWGWQLLTVTLVRVEVTKIVLNGGEVMHLQTEVLEVVSSALPHFPALFLVSLESSTDVSIGRKEL